VLHQRVRRDQIAKKATALQDRDIFILGTNTVNQTQLKGSYSIYNLNFY